MADSEYFGIQPTNIRDVETRYRYLAAASQASFAAQYEVGYVDVYHNGIHLDPQVGFTATDGSYVTLTNPASLDDSVVIVCRRQILLTEDPYAIYLTVVTLYATAGQTSFPYVYTAGSVYNVTRNGIGVPFNASSGTNIIISAANLGDEVKIYSQVPFAVASALNKGGDTATGPIGLAANSTSVTPDFGDSSSRIATTAFVDLGYVSKDLSGNSVVNSVQIGDSTTATENFVLETGGDGTAKLARGNLGSTTQDIFTVDVNGVINFTQGVVTSLTRQTVVSGPVNASGLPSFLPTTSASLSLTSQNITSGTGAFLVSSANGFTRGGALDKVGISTTNLTWPGLTASATNYLYVDISTTGVLTPGSTTLAPVYQVGGTRSVTSNQCTYNITEAYMTVGNGSSAVQVARVFVGEAVTGTTTVTSTVAYAYQGRFDSGAYALAINTLYSKTHNLGVSPTRATQIISQNADGSGWCVFAGVQGNSTGINQGTCIVTLGRNNMGIRTGANYVAYFADSAGTNFGATTGYGRQIVERGW